MCGMAIPYTYWPADEGGYIGYLNEYPDHLTQGKTISELEFMLGDLLDMIKSGDLGEFAPRSQGSFVRA